MGRLDAFLDYIGALFGLRLGVCLGLSSEAEKMRTSAAKSLFLGTCMTKNGKRVSKVAAFNAVNVNRKVSEKHCFRIEKTLNAMSALARFAALTALVRSPGH